MLELLPESLLNLRRAVYVLSAPKSYLSYIKEEIAIFGPFLLDFTK